MVNKWGKYVRFKNYEKKVKSLLVIYIDFWKYFVLEYNEKQNLDEPYTSRCQKMLLVIVIKSCVWMINLV